MNTNCLEGCRCPNCGQDKYFKVQATSLFVITDDGSNNGYDIEYDGDSYANCPECDWEGTWGELQEPKNGD